jgi:hypothetical protein
MINGSTTPTIEEFSEEFISSEGFDDSRYAPNGTGIGIWSPENARDNSRDSQTDVNSGDPPTGPREWRDKMGIKRG